MNDASPGAGEQSQQANTDTARLSSKLSDGAEGSEEVSLSARNRIQLSDTLVRSQKSRWISRPHTPNSKIL